MGRLWYHGRREEQASGRAQATRAARDWEPQIDGHEGAAASFFWVVAMIAWVCYCEILRHQLLPS